MERKIAYDILCAVLLDGKYASLCLKETLKEVPAQKRGFITELVGGVLRHYYLLCYQFMGQAEGKTKEDAKILLAMAMYERYWLKKPAYTASSYVDMAKNYDKGFVNAMIRKSHELAVPDMNTELGEATYYSLPLWLYKLLKAQYPDEIFKKILDDSIKLPRVFYRLNHKKATYADLKDLDIEIINDDSFVASKPLIDTDAFKEGLFYVQDLNSAKIIKELDLKEADVFLDVCSAPGSKLFNALDIVKEAYGNDINASRVELIRKKAELLGLEGYTLLVGDGKKLEPSIINKADKILLDAPCSGLGVLKRKPDIRYHLKDTDIDDLVILQRELLKHITTHMKKGAILVYSTCTLNTKENARQIASLCKEDSSLVLLNDKTYLEGEGADCFYSAKLLKI